MLPAETWLEAARRWLVLLQTSPAPQAWQVIRGDSSYADISTTQYMSGLDLLIDLGLVSRDQDGPQVSAAALATPAEGLPDLLFREVLRGVEPPWLRDADVLVADADDLPQDAIKLAAALGLGDAAALTAVRQVHGKLNLAARARIGLAGETAVVQLLRTHGLSNVRHVALADDGLGYDVAARAADCWWHIEVKSTSAASRLRFFLSRHEFAVGQLDPNWLLVIVALDGECLSGCWTVDAAYLAANAPQDGEARWETARYSPRAAQVVAGIKLGTLTIPSS